MANPIVIKNIAYGQGGVELGQGRRMRDLLMDLYLPAAEDGARPAVLFAFGGGFLRGTKENDAFFGPQGNTSNAEYCRIFASLGFVGIAIDYRLAQEKPIPGTTVAVSDPDAIPRSRINEIAELLGLGPVSNMDLWRAVEAASDDMAAAVRFVRANAARWMIDPDRIAIAGFSAGARTALNVAFAEKVPVRAVVSLSGCMEQTDLNKHVTAGITPDVLIIYAENDLPHVCASSTAMAGHMQARGIHCEIGKVPGHGHFYPSNSRLEMQDGKTSDVATQIREFLVTSFARDR